MYNFIDKSIDFSSNHGLDYKGREKMCVCVCMCLCMCFIYTNEMMIVRHHTILLMLRLNTLNWNCFKWNTVTFIYFAINIGDLRWFDGLYFSSKYSFVDYCSDWPGRNWSNPINLHHIKRKEKKNVCFYHTHTQNITEIKNV